MEEDSFHRMISFLLATPWSFQGSNIDLHEKPALRSVMLAVNTEPI